MQSKLQDVIRDLLGDLWIVAPGLGCSSCLFAGLALFAQSSILLYICIKLTTNVLMIKAELALVQSMKVIAL